MRQLNFGKSSPLSRQIYYVFLDDIHAVEDGYQIIFDGIERCQLGLLGNSSLQETYEEIRPYFFAITIDQKTLEAFLHINKGHIYKSRWLELIVSDKPTPLSISILPDSYTPESESPRIQYVNRIKQIPSSNKVSTTLSSYFSWYGFEISSRETIADVLEQSKPTNKNDLHKLNVFEVGQGNLSAICNVHNMPLLYFDLGGGFAWNKHTYPRTLRLCFTQANTVVISHWDGDHLETAKRHFGNTTLAKEIAGKIWIVPEQQIGPSHFKLAAKMNATGQLIIWPKTLRGVVTSWFGRLIRCNGPEKNHSGIALIVECEVNDLKCVLHPADAAYIYIPHIRRRSFDGLVATHHGAEFDNGNTPVPNCGEGNIAYCYGNGNIYAHPRVMATNAHDVGGWHIRRDGMNGNISFTKNLSYSQVPCGGTCDLGIVQSY